MLGVSNGEARVIFDVLILGIGRRGEMNEGVLVTGAGGVVGTALVGRLEALVGGQRLTCFRTRLDCDLENFAETAAVIRFIRPRYVYHLAGAVFGVGGNLKVPGDAFRRNIQINTNVVEACRLSGVEKIVAMGSVAIYADKPGGHFVETDAFDGRPHGSEEAYAFAKRALLMQLESYRTQFGLEFAYAVSTNMYGENDRFDAEYGHVVPSLVKKFDSAAMESRTVSVWGDGTPTRDFLYADDAAMGLELLMDQGKGVYNLASGHSNTIAELVQAIAAEYPEVRIEWDTTKPLGQRNRSYDVSRLRALGFSPQFDLRSGIRRTVAWYRAHRDSARGYALA